MSEQDPDLKTVERIYDALEGGDPESALRLAREALGRDGDDPVVRFLAGLACIDLDRIAEAVLELQAAIKLDPDDAEARAQLGYALYRACRFQESSEEASKALELDDANPDAHHTAGLLAERRGDFAESDACFARAHAIDPEGYPQPVRLDDDAFQGVLDEARAFLNETFRKHLDDVSVHVDQLPSDEVLRETDPPMDPELLGLFVGVPRSEQTHYGPGGELPPQIMLYQRNLERIFPETKMLKEEIGRTLHHELGHYLGLDEDELEAIDLH